MTDITPAVSGPQSPSAPGSGHLAMSRRIVGWLPTWDLIGTKLMEIRKRRGLMTTAVLLIIGPIVLILGLRLLFHAVDPHRYGPAGTPGIFSQGDNLLAEFGFIIAAVIGAAAGTTDLSDGLFRGLVVTGRSRLALYLARIPAGLTILVPLVAAAFAAICLVTSYEGTPQPASVGMNGVSIPVNLDQAQLDGWIRSHPEQAVMAFTGPQASGGQTRYEFRHDVVSVYDQYTAQETAISNPAINEMAKIGLWIELETGIGFLVGLGLGSLTGHRALTAILMIGLEIIVTPILAAHVIPYFIDGQRLVVGVAMDQLRPAGLGPAPGSGPGGGGPVGPGRLLIGGRGALSIPPMPTWAMISVIVGWIVGWSAIGAWRMMTRDA
jgi:hypothetical protein